MTAPKGAARVLAERLARTDDDRRDKAAALEWSRRPTTTPLECGDCGRVRCNCPPPEVDPPDDDDAITVAALVDDDDIDIDAFCARVMERWR